MTVAAEKAGSGDCVHRNVRIPRALIRDAARFGGRVEGDCLRGDLVIRDGRPAGLTRDVANASSLPAIDHGGGIVLPRLVEAHCHLDKCHTYPRLAVNGDTLADAIEAHERDAANCTAADIRACATRGLEELHAAGCGVVRTHVDWTVDESESSRPPLAWEVLGELAQEWRGRIDLQRAALLSIDDFADRGKVEPVAGRIAADGGVLGAFVLDHEGKAGKIDCMVELARHHGLMLDFHVDEAVAAGCDGLSTIVESLIAHRFERPVLCGHCCGLMALEGDALSRLIDRIATSRVAIAALPTTNLYLQARGPDSATPDRRGLTRVRELERAGVKVVFGSDNVRDAFCPTGFHSPLAALALGVYAAHLDAPFGRWLRTISIDAAAALGAPPPFIEDQRADGLVFTSARDMTELLSAPRLPA